MNFSLIDNVLWAAGVLGAAALLTVLVYRRRSAAFPFFTGWMAFQVALSGLLFFVYRHGSSPLYAKIYWISVPLDFLLQLAVVFEIAAIVLRPTGTWLRDARTHFWTMGAAGVIPAAVVACLVHPSALSSLDAWEVRGNLFTSMITCELFLAMLIASNRLGLHWRNHVMGLGKGLTAWALISFSVDALHSLMGEAWHFRALEHLRILGWLFALGYWTLVFWLPEPERLPLSPEMRDYLVALHQRVRYDLAKVRPFKS
jgi:hypothetical protein